MKAIINQNVLLKELRKFSLVIKKNPVIPIMSTVLFEFNKNKLTLKATDLETTYISTIECESKDKFSLPIEHSKITDICSSIGSPLELELKDKGISIVSGKSKYNLGLFGKAEEFPSMPTDEYEIEFDADGGFYFYLTNANSCRSKEENMINFDMAALDIKKKSMFIVATNGSSVYKKELPIKNKKELVVMIPENFVLSCKGFQESKICIGEKFIKAEYGNDIVISRLSEQKFPDYNVVIAPEIEYNTSINKDELISAINSVMVIKGSPNDQCVISFVTNSIKLTTQNIDFASDAEMELDIEHSVTMDAIALNASRLKHLLSTIDSDNILMSFNEPNKAVYAKPENDDSLLILLMPLQLLNN